MGVFDEQYKKLNSSQREVVDTIEGPVMVIAGPGTGKTTILTLRIANILEKTDVPPDAILALTFTESGVRSMRKKLGDIIGPLSYRVHIYTFHGFANDIIKKYPDRFPRIIGSEHVQDIEQVRLMQKVLDAVSLEKLRPINNPGYYVIPCLDAIKDLKRENISSHTFETLVHTKEQEILSMPDLYHDKGAYKGKMKGEYIKELEQVIKNKELARVYFEYEKLLDKERLYDFEDMIMEVVRYLEKDEDFRLRLQEEYQYILADEHQDANAGQNKILELLSSFHENPNLCIVGDEKQAIFRFQGASLENFFYFTRKYPTAKIISLDRNYRSHQIILDASHALIEHNPVPDSVQRVMLKGREELIPEKIRIVSADDFDAEREFVVRDIEQRIKAGIDPKEIAVLVRDNRSAEPIEKALKSLKIGVNRLTDIDALSHIRIEGFLSLLALTADLSLDEVMGKVLFLDFLELNPITVSEVLKRYKKEQVPIGTLLESTPECKEFVRKLKHWATIVKNEHLVDAVEIIAKESGFIAKMLSREDAHEVSELYRGLLQFAERLLERKKTATVSDFLSRISDAREHGKKISVSIGKKEGVVLMTAHRSKGLEFGDVYIVHANHGVWGGKKNRSSFDLPLFTPEEGDEDERRLFYVALTRAKHRVTVSYSVLGPDGKDLLPSRFIEEVKSDLRVHTGYKRTGSSLIGSEKVETTNTIPFKDLTYIKSKFLDRPLSVTHLNNYISCPWKYFFVNLIQIPQAQATPLLFGVAMHAALRFYFDAYAREESVSVEAACNFFEDSLRRTYLSHGDFKTLSKEGKQNLKGYLKSQIFSKNIFNEYRIGGIRFECGSETVELNGTLDKVEIVTEGHVRVFDYKTGKPKSRNEILGKTKSADGNYWRQLVFYKILVDRHKNDSGWVMDEGELDFIEPTENGVYKKELFSVTDEDILRVEDEIRTMVHGMTTGTFWNKGCGDTTCEWCTLKKQAGW